MKTRTRRAFSLVELLTVIGIIALLISILMPALGRARELARRTVCLANLRGIAQGCVVYAEGARGRFPSWDQRGKAGFSDIGDFWDWDGVSPNSFSGVTVNFEFSFPISNTRNLWKLVQMQGADTKTWLCPSDGDAGEPFTPAVLKSQVPANSSISDVQNRSQFSYAFQYQGPAFGSAPSISLRPTREGWNTTTRDNPKLVILADSSPMFRAKDPTAIESNVTLSGGSGSIFPTSHSFEFASSIPSTTFPAGNKFVAALNSITNITWDAVKAQASYSLTNAKDLESLNSPNHRSEGQNYLRLDGSGDFAGDPWPGAYMDNIWTMQDPSVYQNPSTDSQILAGRMLGTSYDAGSYANTQFDTALGGPMEKWVRRPESKDPYPDSFLVP